MAVLDPKGMKILKLKNAAPVKRDPITITWDPESAKKQGFKHFMLKEIHEQAQSLRDALRTEQLYYDQFAKKIIDADKVFIVACGRSHHARLVGRIALATLAGINARVVVASEYSEEAIDLVGPKSVILAISQSGETMDTLNAVRDAKAKGATILSILNVLGSTLMRLSTVYIDQNAGPEIGVASTKAFTSQIAVLLRLASTVGRRKGEVSAKEITELEAELHRVPALIQSVLNSKIEDIRRIAEECDAGSSICFVGRGGKGPTAVEERLNRTAR